MKIDRSNDFDGAVLKLRRQVCSRPADLYAGIGH